MKTTNTQIQDDQQTKQNEHREKHSNTHHNQIAKKEKKKRSDKEKTLKAASEKKDMLHMGTRVKFSNEFSMKIMQVRKQNDI